MPYGIRTVWRRSIQPRSRVSADHRTATQGAPVSICADPAELPAWQCSLATKRVKTLTTPKRLFEIRLNGEVAPAAIAAAPTNPLALTVPLTKAGGLRFR